MSMTIPSGAGRDGRPGRARRGGRRLRAAAVVLAVVTAVTGAGQATATAGRTQAGPGPSAPPEFVSLRSVDPTILQDIRYRTAHNFTGRPVEGYEQPLCVLTRPAAEALHRVQVRLLREGYSLKVYDCYRPQRAVDSFVEWAQDPDDELTKEEFYPDVDKSRLFEDGYIAERSGHSRGSTVDLTLVELPAKRTRAYRPGEPLVPCHAPQEERFPDNSVDMGTGYDCFDTLSHTFDPRVTGEQRANRLRLREALGREGFAPYDLEWWHFTHRPETFPDTYFDFPVARRPLAP